MPTLEILICTIDEGINKVINNILPPISSIKYLISWQQTRTFSDDLLQPIVSRSDVRVLPLPGKGLSRNRNNALQNAIGDILLISDDDVRYKEGHFKTILAAFANYPEADILTFQMCDEKGDKIKQYPLDSFLYPHNPKGYYISSWEIALHRSTKIPLFDERFGLGATVLACGEEEIFIHDAYLKGAAIRYIPEIIGTTEKGTTGTLFHKNVKVRRSKGAVLYLLHGYWGAVLRCIKFALLLHSNKSFSFFKDMYEGILYIKNTKQ